MALILNDRVKETTTTSGTNNFILGGAVSGYQAFSVIGNGSQTYYACADQVGTNWEVGIGTYVSSTNTLSRDTILSSSNGGAKVAFGTGTKDIFVTYPSERALYADASNNISLNGAFTGTFNGTVGATTPNTGAFTTLSASSTVTLSSGTANGVLYLNGSKAVTSGSALTFDGSQMLVAGNERIYFNTFTNASTHAGFFGRNTSTGALELCSQTIGGGYPINFYQSGNLRYQIDNNGNSIWTIGSEQMRLTSTGLGIGTSSPDATLVLNNATASQLSMKYNGSLLGWLYAGSAGFYVASTNFTGFSVGGIERMRLDSSGNLGLGVTPSGWYSTFKAFQFGASGSSIFGRSENNTSAIGSNMYVNAAGSLVYIANGYASYYQQLNGQHQFNIAGNNVSGAGAAATFTQAMTLDASGRLLLGLTSALSNPASGAPLLNLNADGLVIKRSSASTYPAQIVGNFNSGDNLGFINQGGSNGASYAIGDATHIWYGNATGATERMRLDSAGNLGLGVTPSAWGSGSQAIQNGSYALSIYGLTRNAYYDGANYKYVSTAGATLYQPTANQHAWYTAPSGTAGDAISFTQAMTLDASGNLGIGTTSPAAKLDVNGNIYCRTGYKVLADTLGGYSGGDLNITTNTSGAVSIIFSTRITEAARIDSSGNLLVGTTSANGKLYVASASGTGGNNARFDLTGNSLTAINVYSVYTGTSNNNNNFKHFAAYSGDSGVDVFRVYGQGNVVNTNNSYGAISDQKLKENIVDATPKLSDLEKVRVVNYNLISDPNTKQLGVIAQELEAIFPSLVEESADTDVDGNDLGTTTKSVKYSVFIPILIKAIQEQQAIIESLQARITTLEGK